MPKIDIYSLYLSVIFQRPSFPGKRPSLPGQKSPAGRTKPRFFRRRVSPVLITHITTFDRAMTQFNMRIDPRQFIEDRIPDHIGQPKKWLNVNDAMSPSFIAAI